MQHKCEYCEAKINPCIHPCIEFKNDTRHVCCTCDLDSSKCELPYRIVCEDLLCQLKYKIDWYKIKLEECQKDITKLKAVNNQFRIVNIGSQAAQRLIDEGTLDITGIKSFTVRQRLTWDQIPVETGYMLMCLHEEFAKQWASFLNEKAVKIQIKKELIAATEEKLKKAREQRTIKSEKKSVTNERIILNSFEKLVFHNMKVLKMSQKQAEAFVRTMGVTGEARKIEV